MVILFQIIPPMLPFPPLFPLLCKDPPKFPLLSKEGRGEIIFLIPPSLPLERGGELRGGVRGDYISIF